MSGTRKVTYGAMASLMPKRELISVQINGMDEIELQVLPYLTFEEAMTFVNDVASSVIDEKKMEYTPEAYEFAIRLKVMEIYCGIRVPSKLDKAYEVLFGTNIFDSVMDAINITQYNQMIEAIYNRVEYYKSMMTAVAGDKVRKMMDEVTKMMEDGERVLQQASELDLGNLVQMVNILKDPSTAELSDIVTVLPRE